ncbi:Reducing polyketide synthase DEP5 [Metarhizium brunneum]|uniref:Reducing polyketide synthase DEP5 n=1 Tax=Metarhizium brunneum TaxID=500148 RepID=A0A7D5V2W0_9HYPO|nr:Reducing polyketide synthase DEP5 [Metarhizium brunneum]
MPHRSKLTFNINATYFLVGCLGGVGRCLTAWMIKRGARRFAFMSRPGLGNKQTASWIHGLKARGIACQISKGDASNTSDIDVAIRSIPSECPHGLFHTMSIDDWQTSIAPKALAAMNLDQAFAEIDIDFFVFTSSTSGILGTPGQANYAAGNSFLDNLARNRMARGQRAVSLVHPMVQSVGVVAENPEIEAALRRKGIYGFNETHLLEALEAAIATQATTTPADHIVVGMDPSKLKNSLSRSDVTDSFWIEDARFKAMLQAIDSSGSSDHGSSGFTILKAIQEASSLQVSVGLVSEHFTTKLCRLLMLEPDVFEPEVLPIVEYGPDSMIGAELRNWIFKEYGLDIPLQQLFELNMTITKFPTIICNYYK